jgi:hypothetical protein
VSDKRRAFESPVDLVRPSTQPVLRRPAATTMGAVLVVLRVLAGVWWLLALTFSWNDVLLDDLGLGDEPDFQALGNDVKEAISSGILNAVLIVGGIVLAIELLFALLVFRGVNWARVVVMVFATLSIIGSFVGWWLGGQEITVHTTLVTLALDILVLLALSSRNARAYARRPRVAKGRGASA